MGAGEIFWIKDVSVRELPGNHAFQTSSAKRPKLAARYNLLDYSEEFDQGVWTKVQATVTPNATTAPNGTLTADKLVENTATAGHDVRQTITAGATPITISCYCKAAERDAVLIGDFNLNLYATFKLTGAGSVLASNATSTQITALSNGWYLCVVNGTAAAGGRPYGPRLCDAAGNSTYTGDGVSGLFIWGFDLRPTSQATGLIGPTYQRVAAATVYDTAGFLPYLAFDGLSWSMSTNSIDFSAGDKVTAWAGVRKLSDAQRGNIIELGNLETPTNGSFFLNGPLIGATPRYSFASAGTASQNATYTNAAVAAPVTNVLTGIGDISGDSAILRVNGAQAASNTGDQGTGNYGNYSMFIGARADTSLFFNGWMYSLTVRGAQSSASEISAMESWVAGKTGVSI
jgi:hypothetical protein